MADQRARQRAEPSEVAEGDAPKSPVCPVSFCPVGLVLTMTDQARPEVIQHLLTAGQELLLAVKAVVDARAESMPRSSPLERITIE
jgi:hypothetical protein